MEKIKYDRQANQATAEIVTRGEIKRVWAASTTVCGYFFSVDQLLIPAGLCVSQRKTPKRMNVISLPYDSISQVAIFLQR